MVIKSRRSTVDQTTGGRPPKPAAKRKSMVVKFRITPQQKADIEARRPGESINAYARNRLLHRRTENSVVKKKLNKAGALLKRRVETLGEQASALASQHPGDPDAIGIVTDVSDLRTVLEELLEINKLL